MIQYAACMLQVYVHVLFAFMSGSQSAAMSDSALDL